MAIIEIKSLNEPGIEVFSTLTEAQLRMELEPEKGLFIAESPKGWILDGSPLPYSANGNT